MLLIENAQQQRQTGAAVESFRNEMVKASINTASIFGGAFLQNDDVGEKNMRLVNALNNN